MSRTNTMGITESLLPTFLLIFCLDQTTKFLATLAGLHISYNTGVSLSFFSGSNANFLTALLGILIFYLYRNFTEQWQKNGLAAGLFFGGAVANLFDRIIFGSVRDWLFIPFTNVQNNLADWAIFAGLLLFVLPHIFIKRKKIDR